MRIFVLGIWDLYGGASGECLGAVQLWRRNGLDVTLIPTWTRPREESFRIAERLGCEVVLANPRRMNEVEGLPGSTVVSFCNERAYSVKTRLRKFGCRYIVVPCMCFPEHGMRTAMKGGYVDALVFQSEFQRGQVEKRLKSFSYTPDMGNIVRGYLDWENVEYKPLPHAPGEPFVVGRIARDSTNKWHQDTWAMYDRIPNSKPILLGVGHQAKRVIGRIPERAECYSPGEVTNESVYRRLHAYVTFNPPSTFENWPRVGLEAAAYGVPLVTEKQGGWAEQFEDGVSSLQGDTWEAVGDLAASLANDEERRLELARTARTRLADICNADEIWDQWRKVLNV